MRHRSMIAFIFDQCINFYYQWFCACALNVIEIKRFSQLQMNNKRSLFAVCRFICANMIYDCLLFVLTMPQWLPQCINLTKFCMFSLWHFGFTQILCTNFWVKYFNALTRAEMFDAFLNVIWIVSSWFVILSQTAKPLQAKLSLRWINWSDKYHTS